MGRILFLLVLFCMRAVTSSCKCLVCICCSFKIHSKVY